MAFLTILAQSSQFWTDAAQNDQFLSFPEKKRHFFTLPKTSILAKNQGNPMCGFPEKRLHDRETDRETDRRTETRQYLMVRIARWASDQK